MSSDALELPPLDARVVRDACGIELKDPVSVGVVGGSLLVDPPLAREGKPLGSPRISRKA